MAQEPSVPKEAADLKLILTGATGMVVEGVFLEALEHPAVLFPKRDILSTGAAFGRDGLAETINGSLLSPNCE